VTREWLGEEVLTLADLLRSGLRAVIVGINPSPVSVAAGHYYQGANGKRWWAALREAGILPDGDGWEDDRLFAAGIGFTDLVKRATARETGLHPDEREQGRTLLQERLDGLGVERVLFVYKSSAKEVLGPFPGWGLRPGRPVAGNKAWVMCGPMAPGADRVKAIRQLRAWWRTDPEG
jgi:TDG/mug DNA glycosylase family protein